MNILKRNFYDRHIGSLISLWHFGREVHVSDGTTYEVEVTWLRREINFDFWTPRIPRAVRREREAERQRVHAIAEAALINPPWKKPWKP